MKRRDLERYLTGHGCRPVREGGSHTIWMNPATGARAVVPRHTEIKMPTGKGICRQLGVPAPPFR
ncbi:MAG: type II toxin-antitoxin system HicA family toxin [Actinomycetota bacterium]|nr:type II toxin-antitoxin system HicA family toxin [Actinomycetota bacterium]